MTIVDVLLHKWRMLDDRRRRVFLGAIILAVLLIVVIIWSTSGSSVEPPKPEPEPTTTMTPVSPTTTVSPITTTTLLPDTTTQNTPTTTHGPDLKTMLAGIQPSTSDNILLSTNTKEGQKGALLALKGFVVDKATQSVEFMLTKQTFNMLTFDGELLVAKNNQDGMQLTTRLEIEFDRSEEESQNGQLVGKTINLQMTTPNGVSKHCRISGQNLFTIPTNQQHYKCQKRHTYELDCFALEPTIDDKGMVLVLDNLEVELNRPSTGNNKKPVFLAPAVEC